VIAMLSTLLAVLLVAVVVLALGVGLAVAPYVVSIDMAERRGFSTTRWGAVCLVPVGLMLVLGFEVVKRHAPGLLLVPVAAFGWLTPLTLLLVDDASRLGGSGGAHEA
jgi:hypothetical protein